MNSDINNNVYDNDKIKLKIYNIKKNKWTEDHKILENNINSLFSSFK